MTPQFLALTVVGMLGTAASAAVRPLPPTITGHKQHALDLAFGGSMSRVTLEPSSLEGRNVYTGRAGEQLPFLTVRRGFSFPGELVLGPDGLGFRFGLLDARDRELPLAIALGLHVGRAAFTTATQDSVSDVTAGASVSVGGEWGDAEGRSVRPYLSTHFDSADVQRFAVPDLASERVSSGAYIPPVQGVGIGILQPVLHVAAGVDFPIHTQKMRVSPGLLVDMPVAVGPGALTVSACSACAVEVLSVSSALRPGGICEPAPRTPPQPRRAVSRTLRIR